MASLEEQLAALPDAPGVYIHKDQHGKILYIGKARSLKNRVRIELKSKIVNINS